MPLRRSTKGGEIVGEKKSRILYIKRFLEEYADEEHPAAIADILAYLADVDIPASRKTVAQDIGQLIESGVDVICNRVRQNRYFIGDRLFELPEIKLLLDAVQASKFLTVKRSKSLTDKLLTFASTHQADAFNGGLYLENYAKPENGQAYITADLLHKAIHSKKRVSFMYYEYTPQKKKVYKHNRQVYEFSPWAFVWQNDSYYIIGYSEIHGKPTKFRVDRIAAPKLTDIGAVPAPEDFDLAAYVKAVFQMYDGDMLDVTLKCKNELMKSIIDRFGEDVDTKIADAGHFYVTVRVSVSKTFFGWVFASDGAVEITEPYEAVKAYGEMLERAKTFVVRKPL